MSTRSTPWEQGTPCWADLGTTDLSASVAFYSAVLGWQVMDMGPEFGHYAICSRNGLATAGVGPVMSEDQPSAWTTYLAADDADKVAEAVAASGGTIASAPMDVADQGRMAIALDPTGAVFGIWQANTMLGSQLVNEPGGMCWNDHNSADPDTARRFYSAVFGYTYTAMEGDQDYATIDGPGPGGTIGGIGALPPEAAGTPAHWMVYFAVEDADTACATATAQGGRVVEAAVDTPYGRMATLTGPEGAMFKIMGITSEAAAEM